MGANLKKWLRLVTNGNICDTVSPEGNEERVNHMKHTVKMLCCLLCALLLCGCQAAQEASASLPTFSEETPKAEILVHTVEELVAAIAPNTTIALPSGTLMLSEGSPTGSQNPYCKWEFDSLVISNVDGLTIRGSGKDLSVVKTEPRDATVLTFQNCRDLTLTGFTAGHTQRSEPCEGNVLDLKGCSKVTVSDVGLFGCGAVGVNGWMVRDLTLKDTDIYDCSSSGVSIYQGGGILLENCRIYNIGAEQDAMYALDVSECMDVRLENCRIDQNRAIELISCYASTVQLKGCSMEENSLTDVMFHVYGQYAQSGIGPGATVELMDTVFLGNTAWNWLDTGAGGQVKDGEGELTEEDMVRKYGSFTRTEEEAATGDPGSQRDQITVKNADEFLAAIGPDREIILDCPLIDLSTASTYGTVGGEYHHWEDPFDGPQLVITDVENLTIRGKDGKAGNVLSAVPRYAQVLAFSNCTNLTLRDLTAGHTKEPGYCMGGVLQFLNCGNVTVEACGLFGCGTIGVDAQYSSNLRIADNDIYECSFGGVNLYRAEGVTMEGNTFRDLGDEYGGYIYCTDRTSRNVCFDGELVQQGSQLLPEEYPAYQK